MKWAYFRLLHLYEHIYTLKPIKKNTQQDLKIYCWNHYVRKTLQNLSQAIADHIYGINLLPHVMTY